MPLMKLHYDAGSALARKVIMLSLEVGLYEQIKLMPVDSWAVRDPNRADRFTQYNPLGRGPILVLEDGFALYDSPVICDYLDTRHEGPKFYPASGAARWRALRLQALADGLIEATLQRVTEDKRGGEFRSTGLIEHLRLMAARTLERFEVEIASLDGPLHIGNLSVLVALADYDFRFPWDDWRRAAPRLAQWYAGMTRLESFEKSMPETAAQSYTTAGV